MFVGTVKLVRNATKCEFTYNGHGMAFHGSGMWNFGDGFTRNIVICVVDNSLTSHADNKRNNFLVLGKAPT